MTEKSQHDLHVQESAVVAEEHRVDAGGKNAGCVHLGCPLIRRFNVCLCVLALQENAHFLFHLFPCGVAEPAPGFQEDPAKIRKATALGMFRQKSFTRKLRPDCGKERDNNGHSFAANRSSSVNGTRATAILRTERGHSCSAGKGKLCGAWAVPLMSFDWETSTADLVPDSALRRSD